MRLGTEWAIVQNESFQHQVADLLSCLQVALKRFEADLPLSETQRALVQTALRAAGDRETTSRDACLAEPSNRSIAD